MSHSQVNIELELNGASEQQVPFVSPVFMLTYSCESIILLSPIDFKAAGSSSQKKGATVSFHNIHYEVNEGGSCLCRKKSLTKAILINLK